MGELSLNLPVVGEKDTTAEPKVTTALTEIQTQFNGKIAAVNLEAKAVTEAKLATALVEKLTPTTSIIATEQSRESATFGTLTTPDEVTLVLPENGLIAVAFQATWKNSVASAGRAAIFVGATQLKVATLSTAPVVQEASTALAETEKFGSVGSAPIGLLGANNAGYTGDVTTGQVIGAGSGTGGSYGPCTFFAAAGTYGISVQFRATAGNVTVKNRKLWAWII